MTSATPSLSIWAPAAQLLRAGPRPFDRPSPPWKTTTFLRGKSWNPWENQPSMAIFHGGHAMFEPGDHPKCLANLLPAHIHIPLIYHHIPIIRIILGQIRCRFQKMSIRSCVLFLSNTKQWSTPMASRMGPGPNQLWTTWLDMDIQTLA